MTLHSSWHIQSARVYYEIAFSHFHRNVELWITCQGQVNSSCSFINFSSSLWNKVLGETDNQIFTETRKWSQLSKILLNRIICPCGLLFPNPKPWYQDVHLSVLMTGWYSVTLATKKGFLPLFPIWEQEKITLDSFTEEEKQKRKRNQLMVLNPISASPPRPVPPHRRANTGMFCGYPLPAGVQELGALHRDTHCSEPEGLPSGLLASWAAPLEADYDDVKAFLRETHLLPGKALVGKIGFQEPIVETIQLLQCLHPPPAPRRGLSSKTDWVCLGSHGADTATWQEISLYLKPT